MKSRKALFLASLLLFLISYTNNYAGKSSNIIIYNEKLDFLSGLNEDELRRLILKIRSIKSENFTINDLKDLHDNYNSLSSNLYILSFDSYSFKLNKETDKLVYENKNENIKHKKLKEIIEKSLE